MQNFIVMQMYSVNREKGCSCVQYTAVFKRGKAYATMSKVIMGNGGFYGCLVETQGVSAWLKETAQTRVFLLSRSVLMNHLEPQ